MARYWPSSFYLRPPLHISSSRVVAMEEMDVTVRQTSLFYVSSACRLSLQLLDRRNGEWPK